MKIAAQLVGFLGASLLAGSAFAVAIVPGQTAATVFEANPTGGSVLATLSSPILAGSYSGSLLTQVIQGDTSNPLGGLTFTYKLAVDPGVTGQITRLTVNGFTGYATDMSYKAGTGLVAPSLNDRDNSGGVVGFTFVGTPLGFGTLTQGTDSNLLVVQTNATGFISRVASVSNGTSTQVTSYGPSGAITPEPATITAALAGMALLGRRRR